MPRRRGCAAALPAQTSRVRTRMATRSAGAVRRTCRRHCRSHISQYGSKRPSSRSSARRLRTRSDASTHTRTASDASPPAVNAPHPSMTSACPGRLTSSAPGRSATQSHRRQWPIPPAASAARGCARAARPPGRARPARVHVVEAHERGRDAGPGGDDRIGEGRLARTARPVDQHDRRSASSHGGDDRCDRGGRNAVTPRQGSSFR